MMDIKEQNRFIIGLIDFGSEQLTVQQLKPHDIFLFDFLIGNIIYLHYRDFINRN